MRSSLRKDRNRLIFFLSFPLITRMPLTLDGNKIRSFYQRNLNCVPYLDTADQDTTGVVWKDHGTDLERGSD